MPAARREHAGWFNLDLSSHSLPEISVNTLTCKSAGAHSCMWQLKLSQMSEQQSYSGHDICVIVLPIILIFSLISGNFGKRVLHLLILVSGCALACLFARDVFVHNIATIVQVSRGWKQKLKWLTLLKEVLPNKLDAGYADSITELLADGDYKVRDWTVELLNHRMPSRLLVERFSEFRVHLRSTNSGTADAGRRLFEQKISAEIFAQHFEKIVPPLFSDPNLQLWAFDLITDKMPIGLLGECFSKFLVHLRSTSSGTADASRRLFEQKISAEILAQHFEKIVPPLLADPNLQLWAFDLITDRMPSRLLVEHFGEFLVHLRSTNSGTADAGRHLFEQKISAEILAQHFEKIVPPLLADPNLQLWAFDLITDKMPSRLLGEHFGLFLVHSRSTNSGTADASRRLFEQKISAEILAQHFEKIVPPLLADPNLQLWAFDLITDRMPSRLLVEHFGEFLVHLRSTNSGTADAGRRLFEQKISAEIFAQHFEKIVPPLFSDPNLQLWAFDLITDKMPIGLLGECFSKFLVHLRSTSSGTADASRRLFEQKISAEILAQHFEKIVPPLLADPNLQLWAFDLITDRMPSRLLVEHFGEFLVHLRSTNSGTADAGRHLFEQKISAEILAQHFEKIVPPLLADPNLQLWAFDLITDKMPSRLLGEHFGLFLVHLRSTNSGTADASRRLFEQKISAEILAQHFEKIVPPLLADPNLQLWAFDLITDKMPSRLLVEHFGEFLVHLRSTNSGTADASRRLFEQKISAEILAQHFEKIVPPLLADPNLQLWAFDLITDKMPSRLLGEHFGEFHVHLRSASSGTADASRRLFDQKISAEIFAQGFEKIVPPLLADPNLQLWAFDLITDKMPSRLLGEHFGEFLVHLGSTNSGTADASRHLFEQKISAEIFAQHFEKIVPPLLADPNLQLWAFDLITAKMPSGLLGEHFGEFLVHLRSTNSGTANAGRRLFEQKISAEILAQHFEKIVPPLLADPNLQLWAFDLITDRMPSRLLVEHFGEFLVHLRSTNSGTADASRRLFEQKISAEILAQHFEKIVPPLLADPNLKLWAFDLITDKMPSGLLGEHFGEFLVHLRSTNSGTADAGRRLFEQKISAEILAQHFEKIVPPLLADPNLQLWAFDLIIAHLAADGELRRKEQRLDLLKEQLPSVIGEDHVDSIMPLLANKDSKVRDWAVHLLNQRMPDALFIARFNKLLVHLDKGDIRRLFERKISSEILVEHFDQIVPLLANSDWQVRFWTVKLLQNRSPTALLVEHQEELVSLLSDPSWQVEREAISLLERMPNGLISKHYNKLLARVRSSNSEIRCASRKLLKNKMSTKVLEKDFHEIVPPLLADSELQSWSFGILTGRIPPKHHEDLIELIIVLLREEQVWSKQEEALDFLKAQLPEALGPEHVRKIAAFLDNSECKVKRWTLDLLHERTPPSALAEHGGRIVMHLEDGDSSVRATASALVFKISLSSNLEASIMAEFAALLYKTGRLAKLERGFSGPFDLSQLMSKLPALLVVATRKEDIASWRDAKGNSWLHLAADEGHLEACEALVDQVGLPLREKNKAGNEPLTLAKNRAVDRCLRSRMHVRETRFGHGNAFEEMEQDERQVSEVAWYTVPLPGMGGYLGGLHSFLVVTVSGTSAAPGINHGAKRYVLEKAAGSFSREAHQKHGIFIGSQDLSSNLESVVGCKIRTMKLTLSEGSLRAGLQMKELYQVAHGTGAYDLATSNCHHAVQKVFNHCCASEEDKQMRLPNEWLAKLVGAIWLGGWFNSNSDIASVNSEVVSGRQLVDSPSRFTRSVDVRSDDSAHVAAALSLAVYEEDPAIVLRPTAAGAVSIRNKLGRTVILHDHTTQTRHRVDADGRESLHTDGADKIFVDVYAVEWMGLYPWRCLARRQAVWSGHAYDLSTDFRDEVVLQEVVSYAPNQPVDVRHATQKSGSNSPVQWLLARSWSKLYVAFRGTKDLQDGAIDLGAVPDFHRFKEYGIGVHGGIAHALEQEGDEVNHVVHDVLQVLDKHRLPGEQLVLCGHSLGGAYAQVMAVHLLSRKVEVTALRTFGAPHVLVPPKPQESPRLWQKLNSITQHWVHDWDPVPRLPLCKTWLVDVLPKLKCEIVQGVRLGMSQKEREKLQQSYDDSRAKLLDKYDVAGEVVLVSKATGLALGASEDALPSKELLSEEPPKAVMTTSRLPAYHNMEDYFQIARMLTAAS